jgi:uncharacterized protein YecE (DUF72 family)
LLTYRKREVQRRCPPCGAMGATIVRRMVDLARADAAMKDEALIPPQAARIGCAGWAIPRESAADFASQGTHLERYAQTLNCCEINSSFYRLHKNETWERWAKSVPAGFQFSVKMPKTITHKARLNCGPELWASFLQQIRFLHEKLGPVLIQLPPSLEFEETIAKRFFSQLRESHSGDVVCEPRHSSWFDGRADELLQEFRVARVAADPACVPAAAGPGGFAGVAYFRLHGSPRLYYSDYGDDFLNDLAAKLTSLAINTRIWCIFDNTAAGFAAENALELTSKLKKGRGTDFLANCGE